MLSLVNGTGFKRQILLVISILGLLSTSFTASAQVTNSRIRGTVTDATGSFVSGATVSITHSKGMIRKVGETNDEGVFAFTGLKVGGPYTIKVSSAAYRSQTLEGLSLKAGSNPPLGITLQITEVEKITVTAGRVAPSLDGKLYDSLDVANQPSVGGDLKDVIRLSADAYVDGDSLSIGGNNTRFNSITVDGIRQDDDFGLNYSGYPTQRSPISLGSVEELSVNQTPFDVRYGNFLGGNVNVVTKSGSNEVEGGAYLSHFNDKWVGKDSKDRSYATDFELFKAGANVGGAIIEDKLHYFVSFEGLSSKKPSTSGPAGSGASNESANISVSDMVRVQEISQRVYGFDPGTAGEVLEERDFKVMTKFDWEINEDHRLEVKLQRSEGNSITDSYSNDDRLPLTSNWYDRIDTLTTASTRLHSDWNHALSTKMEISKKEVKTRSNPLNGTNFMEAEITTNGDRAKVILGPDVYRHANELDTDNLHLGLEANYLTGEHLITAGWEHDRIDIDNLFGPRSKGQARYDTIEDFEAQTPSYLRYRNAISNNTEDLAAKWGYDTNTIFIQDEYQISPRLTSRFGVRMESYESRGDITKNDNFAERYGFYNDSDLSGKQLVLPRLGLAYQHSNKLSFGGGMGLYGGGTPNVWLSNNYGNDGVKIDEVTVSSAPGFDGVNIPSDVISSLEAQDGSVDALDPDFKLPHSFKFNTNANYNFDLPYLGRNFNLNFNYTYSKVRQGVTWKDLRRNHSSFSSGTVSNTSSAVGPDGRALYDTTPSDDSNSFDENRGYDLMLTNTDKGFGHNANLSLSKSFTNGLSISGSYAWQNVEDVNPGTSSQSTSNYGQVAIGTDPNNPDLARSNYEREHRFILSTSYAHNFFQGLLTNVSMFMERRSGQPYSYTFGGDSGDLGRLFGESSDFSRRERMLFYVPKGDGSDVILDGIAEEDFNAYLSKSGLDQYRGSIAPRNAFTGKWVDNIDMRISQELPGVKDDHRARVVLDVENVPNLINKNWGQSANPNFPYMIKAVDVDYDADSGRYIYSNLDTDDANSDINLNESVWRMQVSLYYDF